MRIRRSIESKGWPIGLERPLPDGSTGCEICVRSCRIGPGSLGLCGVVRNVRGHLQATTFGLVSHASADPIEKKPIYHFLPGSRVFTLGSWSCNLFCRYCRNHDIACAPCIPFEDPSFLSPADAVRRAEAAGCAGIAWSYSEPVVWFDYTYACAVEARAHGLFTAYVTNGTLSRAALDLIGPHLDCWRVDLKGFSDASYWFLGRLAAWRHVLEITVRARHAWGMHVEVVTTLVPGLNDGDAELQALARWIAGELGPMTPWHVQRFYPLRDMGSYAVTPLAALERARAIGRAEGLAFVYLGNCVAEAAADTSCPHCETVLVERRGEESPGVRLGADGSCPVCGCATGLRTTLARDRDRYGYDEASVAT